jgi:predicted transposase YdaD
MATKANSPHDGIFKSAFERPELARSELALILPQAVRAHLDLDTLHVRPGSFRDEDLNQSHSDLLYGVRTTTGEEALVFVLFEHQSEPDPLNMPLRLLRYMARIWERWQIEHPRAKLPIILPVVLHHHAAGWRTEPDFANLLDASPALLEAARPYLPLFRFVLDDLGPLSAEAIAARPLHELARLVLLALWSSRSLRRLEEAAPLVAAIIAKLARDESVRALLRQLYSYWLRTGPADVDARAIQAILLEVAGPQGQEDVVNAAEQLMAEGEQRGLARGRVEGRVEGLRDAIVAALSTRAIPLSEVGRARLAACGDVATLTRWLTLAVTASSEGDVFGGSEAP